MDVKELILAIFNYEDAGEERVFAEVIAVFDKVNDAMYARSLLNQLVERWKPAGFKALMVYHMAASTPLGPAAPIMGSGNPKFEERVFNQFAHRMRNYINTEDAEALHEVICELQEKGVNS